MRANALLAGVGSAYEAIAAGRDELVGAGGLLWRSAGVERQVRVRAAHAYHTLRAESLHPDVMRDALDRDFVLGHLCATAVGQPALSRLARAEVAELRAGTVPYVSGRAGSRDLRTGDGALLHHALPRSGLDRAAEAVRAMGAQDRATQERVLRAWLGETAGGVVSTVEPSGPVAAAAGHDIDQQRCIAVACRLADRLAETAYHHGDRAAWLGLSSLDERRWTLGPLGVGLSDGYPGVALFLAKLAELTGDDRYAVLARRALAHVPAMLDGLFGLTAPAEPPRCGPFHGVTGLAYALVHVAASLGDPTLLDGTVSPIAAAAMAATDGSTDVLGGSAGCVAAMLAVDAAVGSLPARRVAHVGMRRLVPPAEAQKAMAGEPGSASRAAREGTVAPVGFARGASGVGWALLRFAAATGDQRAAEFGLASFRYERGWCPDAPGWCRGAAGVGLSRAASLHAGEAGVGDDLDRAVDAVVSAGAVADHSLCHGELGCLELLLVAAAAGRTDVGKVLARRAAGLLDAVDRFGPRCGTPDAVPTPGLLTGLAGIGYGLLRLAFPHRVASVLLLEPPGSSRPPAHHLTGATR
jgi:type 2 lantibiotic biosynthesis protein LanM